MDPDNITRYDLTDRELEGFLIACICVAGKMAKVWFPKSNAMLDYLDQSFGSECRPLYAFSLKQRMSGNGIRSVLERFKIGNYKNISKKIAIVSMMINRKQLDLRTCTPNELAEIVGFKTSRYFILHSRKYAGIACLDTHILAWMRDNGYPSAPKQSPTNRKVYEKWEQIFLDECKKRRKADIAKFDLEIWLSRRRDVQVSR